MGQEAAGGVEVHPVRNRTTAVRDFALRTVRVRRTVRPCLELWEREYGKWEVDRRKGREVCVVRKRI